MIEQLVQLGDKQLITPQDQTDARKRVLTEANRFLGYFRQRRMGDPKLEAESAQVVRRLANVLRLRGEFGQAATLYDRSVELIEDAVRKDPHDQANRDREAEILLDAGESLNMNGLTREADTKFQQAHDIALNLVGKWSDKSGSRRTWARSLYRRCSTGLALGRDDSLSDAQRAVALFRELADSALPGVRAAVSRGQILPLSDQIELVFAQTLLAEAWHESGRDAEATTELADALARMDGLMREFKDLRSDDVAYFHAYASLQFALRGIDGKEGLDEKSVPVRRLDEAVVTLTDLVKRARRSATFA